MTTSLHHIYQFSIALTIEENMQNVSDHLDYENYFPQRE